MQEKKKKGFHPAVIVTTTNYHLKSDTSIFMIINDLSDAPS